MSTSHEAHPHSLTEQVPPISIPSSAHPSSELAPHLTLVVPATFLPIQQPLSRMLTRSQTNFITLKTFPDYKLYSSTKYLLLALTSLHLPAEPRTYHQAAKNPCWLDSM
jgi:hypothetical protein